MTTSRSAALCHYPADSPDSPGKNTHDTLAKTLFRMWMLTLQQDRFLFWQHGSCYSPQVSYYRADANEVLQSDCAEAEESPDPHRRDMHPMAVGEFATGARKKWTADGVQSVRDASWQLGHMRTMIDDFAENY